MDDLAELVRPGYSHQTNDHVVRVTQVTVAMTMSYENAIKSTGDDTIIDLDVTPGSKSTEVPSGYDEWRNRIRARLAAKAVGGKANKQLIKELSGIFGINQSLVRLSGETSTKKSVKLIGVAREDVIYALRPFLGADVADDCTK